MLGETGMRTRLASINFSVKMIPLRLAARLSFDIPLDAIDHPNQLRLIATGSRQATVACV